MSSRRAASFMMSTDPGPGPRDRDIAAPTSSPRPTPSQTPHRPSSSSRHHSRHPSATLDSLPPERRPLLQRAVFTHDGTAEPWYSCIANPHGHLPVYTNIHRIRRDIVSIVEDYLSLEQLRDVRINLSVVRPLVDKMYELDDISVVYCLLVNRAQFLHEQAHLHNRQNVNATRAMLCELVAIRILRRFNEDNDGPEGLLVLAQILVAGFEPFQNAPAEVREEAEMENEWSLKRTLPALEVAIVSESKMFLSSTSCQKVVDAIYEGRVIYTPSSFLNIIPDRYKQKPISLYNPRESPLLNQYRLIVPRTRKYLELFQFIVLIMLYLAFMAERDSSRLTGVEICFAVYALGWVLDQFATILEHGWHVYSQNLWSFLDVAFTCVYWVYLFLRIYGRQVDEAGDDNGFGQQALDVLAMGAPVLVPRLAFNLLSDNLVFVCLRSMMVDFTLLMGFAAWCFCGFLLSLLWLGNGAHPILTISKWMVYIWFGLDGSGIQRSTEFHWLLGPSLMVTFACLGNTLFLTILVSMLSHTFSTIVSNATAEVQYRHAVQTLEGVKSDILTMYNPPFNILALVLLVPLKFLVSARWFHKIHVTSVRFINLPLLLFIALAERHLLQPLGGSAAHPHRTSSSLAKRFSNSAATAGGWLLRRGWFWEKWRITSHGDMQAVFDIPPPDSVLDDIAADDDLTHHLIRRQFVPRSQSNADHIPLARSSRKDAGGLDGGDGVPSEEAAGRGTITRGESSLGVSTAPATSGGSSDGTRTPRPPKPVQRRDSIAPYAGLPSQLRAALAEGEDIAGLSARLASLEEASERIERLLTRLVEGGAEGVEVGELEEEDQSATEIED